MNLNDYQLTISKSLEATNISNDDILIISKHHSETNLNHIFYKKLHNNVLFIDFPAEAALYSKKIKSCISPFNTTIFQLTLMNHDFDFEVFIGYVIPKSPDLDKRIEKTITIRKIIRLIIRSLIWWTINEKVSIIIRTRNEEN